MPRIKSAKKQLRKSRAANERNRHQRSQLRTAIKKVRSAESPKEKEAALKEATILLSRAGRKNLIHHKTASRTKSRLAKAVAVKK
ncbi:MAG: 30S ribosomal protein S20 [Gemmatimonadales bacterium]